MTRAERLGHVDVTCDDVPMSDPGGTGSAGRRRGGTDDAASFTPLPTFDEIYRRRYESMVRLAYVLVDTTEQAEEVTQEAFAALYSRWRKVSDPEAYLRTSVLNGARAVLRRRRVLRRRAHELHVVDDGQADAADGSLGHVVDAVRRLPDRQRAVVVLRYELQLSEAEIAQTLGIPPGTVKSTLHRALARLRQEVHP